MSKKGKNMQLKTSYVFILKVLTSSAVISETFSFPSAFNKLVELYMAWSSYSSSGSSDTRVAFAFGDSTVLTSVQFTF